MYRLLCQGPNIGSKTAYHLLSRDFFLELPRFRTLLSHSPTFHSANATG
jgi:hypothetical protein